MRDTDVPFSEWKSYLKKYEKVYKLKTEELGIWCIKLNRKLGTIRPYSIKNKKLVAVLDFRSSQHKTFFKKRLVKKHGLGLQITQEGLEGLCVAFPENVLKDVEDLFKIRKRRKLSKEHEEKLRKNIKKVNEK